MKSKNLVPRSGRGVPSWREPREARHGDRIRVDAQELPIILIRGFGGLDAADERKLTYYGFNDGTVYPQRQGEVYIYEGMILRLMKSKWRYQDTTNIINYYDKPQPRRDIVKELAKLPKSSSRREDRRGSCPALALKDNPSRCGRCGSSATTTWSPTSSIRGRAERLIELSGPWRPEDRRRSPKVDIIAHSMGGRSSARHSRSPISPARRPRR